MTQSERDVADRIGAPMRAQRSAEATGFYHRVSVFDNETDALVTDILLTPENVEALRPYLAVGDDTDVIGEHGIGPRLSLFVGAFNDA